VKAQQPNLQNQPALNDSVKSNKKTATNGMPHYTEIYFFKNI
jgi:hypothetical protein